MSRFEVGDRVATIDKGPGTVSWYGEIEVGARPPLCSVHAPPAGRRVARLIFIGRFCTAFAGLPAGVGRGGVVGVGFAVKLPRWLVLVVLRGRGRPACTARPRTWMVTGGASVRASSTHRAQAKATHRP